MANGERALAIFIDFENLALGFQNRRDRFDISRVLERLVEKGKVVAKKAYADWSRFAFYTAPLHEAAIELIEIPRRAQSGKNSADIRLVVDAMDLAYAKTHIDTFVVVSGDSDFSPLVSKLKELGKHVIGLGMQDSTSDLLRDNCDEFIYYEDLDRGSDIPAMDARLPENKRKVFALLLDSLHALRRENKDVIWSSMIKDTMKRKKPSFNESYHGYRSFSELLEDAQQSGLLELDTDKRSRTYVVTRFGPEMQGAPPRPRVERPERADMPELPPEGVVIPTPAGVSGIEIPPGGPRRKSRRRRRGRGGAGAAAAANGGVGNGGVGNGGIVNGGNGQHPAIVAVPADAEDDGPEEDGPIDDTAYEAAAEAAADREGWEDGEEAAVREPAPRRVHREPPPPVRPAPESIVTPVVADQPDTPEEVEIAKPAEEPARGRRGRAPRRGKSEAAADGPAGAEETRQPAARRGRAGSSSGGGRSRKPVEPVAEPAPVPVTPKQGIDDDDIFFPR